MHCLHAKLKDVRNILSRSVWEVVQNSDSSWSWREDPNEKRSAESCFVDNASKAVLHDAVGVRPVAMRPFEFWTIPWAHTFAFMFFHYSEDYINQLLGFKGSSSNSPINIFHHFLMVIVLLMVLLASVDISQISKHIDNTLISRGRSRKGLNAVF